MIEKVLKRNPSYVTYLFFHDWKNILKGNQCYVRIYFFMTEKSLKKNQKLCLYFFFSWQKILNRNPSEKHIIGRNELKTNNNKKQNTAVFHSFFINKWRDRKSYSLHKEPPGCISPHPQPQSQIRFLAYNAKQRAERLSKIWSWWGPLLCWLPWSDRCFTTWVGHQWPPALLYKSWQSKHMKPAEQDICILSAFSGQLHCHVGSLFLLEYGWVEVGAGGTIMFQ